VEQFESLLRDLPLGNRVLLSWMIVHMTHVIAKVKASSFYSQSVTSVLTAVFHVNLGRLLFSLLGYNWGFQWLNVLPVTRPIMSKHSKNITIFCII